MTALIIVIGILLVIIIVVYNNLIGNKNNVENAFGSIDVMLKKRYDLLPNLVELVKTYMEHERGVLVEVTELRTQRVSGGSNDNDKNDIDKRIENRMGKVMMNVENYPNLKANKNFLKLQSSWNEIEEQISAARRSYNSAVTQYNDGFEMFPGNLFAGTLEYAPKEVIEIQEHERQNVIAKELFKKS